MRMWTACLWKTTRPRWLTTAPTEVEDVTVNGLPAVTYVLEESDTACIAFTTEAGYVLEVAGSPKSDEGFAAILSFVMASHSGRIISASFQNA